MLSIRTSEIVPPVGTCAALVIGWIAMPTAPATPTQTAATAKFRRNTPPDLDYPPAWPSGRSSLRAPGPGDSHEIVPRSKHHQHQNQSQAKPEPVFLRALTERLSANCLGEIEQQMSSVKHGDGEEVDQAEVERQQRGEPDQREEPFLR